MPIPLSLAKAYQSGLLVMRNVANTFTAKQTFSAGVSMDNTKIENVAAPTADGDAVNLATLKNFSFDAGTF